MKSKSNKRNPLLMGKIDCNDSAGNPILLKDEFLPTYELEYGLPDIPVKPKLFRHVDLNLDSDVNTMFKYEYSSIEMLQEQQSNQIYTDYNIGMFTNLVDRDVYKPDKNLEPTELSEKLKFVLSSKDTYDPLEAEKQLKMSQRIIIPAKYKAQDKIFHYGGKIDDPF